MNIRTILRCHRVAGDVGVEIELEGRNFPEELASWRKEADASLRGESAEYVLASPCFIEQLPLVLEELEDAFQQSKTKIHKTYRAGVHVHVNVQDLTPLQLVNFVALYYIFEEVFIAFCDPSRRGNHFCLRMSDASYLMDKLHDFIASENIHLLDDQDLRYASLNLTSLFKYGSVESRALESTTDFNKIYVWAKTLVRLRDYAKTVASPIDLIGSASALGFESFAQTVFGPMYEHFAPYASPGNIQRGIRNVQFPLYARDWSTSSLNIFQEKNLF